MKLQDLRELLTRVLEENGVEVLDYDVVTNCDYDDYYINDVRVDHQLKEIVLY